MPGILVSSNFLISVCMFIVSKALLISSATVIVRTGGGVSHVKSCELDHLPTWFLKECKAE